MLILDYGETQLVVAEQMGDKVGPVYHCIQNKMQEIRSKGTVPFSLCLCVCIASHISGAKFSRFKVFTNQNQFFHIEHQYPCHYLILQLVLDQQKSCYCHGTTQSNTPG